MPQKDYLERLNEAQRRAVTFGVDGDGPLTPGEPLLVVAGAGTGKTTTLAHRVAHLILRGADPRRILLLTFTRRAAETMIGRVERILGETRSNLGTVEWAGTFHGIANRLSRMYAREMGLRPGFSVLDRSDAADLMDIVREELGFAQLDRRFPRKATCLAIYSFAMNAQLPLEPVLARQFPWCAEWSNELRRLFAGYCGEKARQNVVDYDDLLLFWQQVMAVPAIADDIGSRFDFVLVDEFQDTNALQGSILKQLKPDGQGVTVVGDDAQAIYGFRAATVHNILEFPATYDPPAAIVPLKENYRSLQPILDAANAVMALAGEGHKKSLFSQRPSSQRPVLASVADDLAQVTYVVGRVLANREAGMRLMDQAVLFRTARHSAALELELVRRDIPFVMYGGLRFLEAAHIKDVLAVLRFAQNPTDRIAGFRSLQLLPGIGPGLARRMLDAVEGSLDGLRALERYRPPAQAQTLWSPLVALLRELEANSSWPSDLEQVRLFYDPLLPDLHENPAPRLADLDQLQALAQRYDTRARFLSELALDPPEASSNEAGPPVRDEDYLVLSTIHSAKGQEWKAIFILNCVDGCIPSDMATGSPAEIEEERRLLYVAMTRAKDDLHLVLPERFFVLRQARDGDRHLRAARTRFIPPSLLPLFESASSLLAGGAADPKAAGKSRTLPQIDIRAQLASMWDSR